MPFTMTDSPSQPPRWFIPTRRWLQFRLKTLFWFLLLISLPLGWLGMKLANKRTELRNAEILRSLGATVGMCGETGRQGRTEPFAQDVTWLDSIGLGRQNIHVEYVDYRSDQSHTHGKRAFLIAKRFARISAISFSNCDIDDDAVVGIERLDNLNRLQLDGSLVSDKIVPRLLHLRKLYSLRLEATLITDSGFEQLAQLPELTSLSVEGTQVTEEAVDRFKVRRPDVRVNWATLPTEAAVRSAGELLRRNVGLWFYQDKSEATCSSEIDLDASATEHDISLLKDLPHRFITFKFYNDSDILPPSVADLEPIDSLRLDWPEDRHLNTLCERRSRLPELVLNYPAEVTADGLAHLDWLPSLKRLTFDFSPTATDEELQFSKVAMGHVTAVRSLEELRFINYSIASDALEPLASLPRLKSLHIRGVNLTEQQLGHLSKLSHLTELHLSGSNLGDEGLERLLKLQDLQELSISETDVTDEGLLRLARLPRLKTLLMDHNDRRTPAGQERLAKARPDMSILLR